jgi:hypothetical protein
VGCFLALHNKSIFHFSGKKSTMSLLSLPSVRRCFWFIVAFFMLQMGYAQKVTIFSDLGAFKTPGDTWHNTSAVFADYQKNDDLTFEPGTGIVVNSPSHNTPGKDLFTSQEYGDFDLEVDILMAKASNSGIYLQGRYEIQLLDSWGFLTPHAGDMGGIYERWDEKRPEGQKGYEGYPPRQNACKAPGLWQHFTISFQAPRFVDGKKSENARILKVELNGVLIQDNVELSGPTRGGGDIEYATGPLRIQGDHGPMAFKNLKITAFEPSRPAPKEENASQNLADPILVDAEHNTILRSFVDIPGDIRVVHSVSVGSPLQVHYTYDQDYGAVVQLWRGGFLDATPMWHSRGDGSSRPQGAVQYFGNPALTVATLPVADAPWPLDTAGSGYRAKGYVLDDQDVPIFKYLLKGTMVSDAIQVIGKSEGVHRQITLATAGSNRFVRLAQGKTIQDMKNGLYLINDKAYYLKLDDPATTKVMIREGINGQKELVAPIQQTIGYTLLF